MIKRILIIAQLAGLSIITGFSQAINKIGLDSFFNALQKHNLSMGSLVISKGGTTIYSKTIGYSLIEENEKIPSTLKTKYRVGSISKMFTSVMIFQLIEEGKISLDMTLDKYFPGLPNAGRITIGNLLNHRSGLHDYTEDPHFKEWMDKPKTHEELLGIITNAKPDYEPNKRASYSSSNYLILSYIIEKICGQPYKDVVDKRIISKIGLEDTYYGSKIDVQKNECFSYRFINNRWQKQTETDMSIHSGAGSIVSTPADLTKFIRALFLNKLISKKSLTKMTTLIDGYGMGIFTFPFLSKTAFGHSG